MSRSGLIKLLNNLSITYMLKLHSSHFVQRLFSFMGLTLFASVGVWAQVYSGTIQSLAGDPVEGVRIRFGDSLVNSDVRGAFSLTSSQGQTVLFSHPDYQEYSTVLGVERVLSISLTALDESINPVVVVGYGTSRKKDLTGSVGSVQAKDLVVPPVMTATSAIQGKLAGVQITNYGGPGTTPTVRIRGTGSVIGGAEPLYVVDGVITDDIRNINTADIVSVDVLKDASSTAIYGVRASNGVILITTKTGKRGALSIDYNGSFGVKSLTNKVTMAGPNLFAIYSNEAAGTFAIKEEDITGRTDWMDAITRTGSQMNHAFTFSGGNEFSTSLLSINYYKEDGILLGNDYERVAVRSNNTFDLSKRIKAGSSMGLSKYHSNNKPYSAFTQAYNAAPIYDAKNADGTYGYTTKSDVGNPLASLELTDDQSWGFRLQGSTWGEVQLAPKLSFRTSYGADLFENNGQNFRDKYYVSPTQRYDTTTLSISQNQGYRWIWDNTLNGSFDAGSRHSFKYVIGHTAERYDGIQYWMSRDGVAPQSQYRYLNIGASTIQANLGYQGPLGDYGRRESYLSRVNYSFEDRILITGTLRRDGSSKFPIQNRWGNFPSMGVAWVLSEEAFIPKGVFDYLKLRGSWGKVGNDRISPSEFVTLLSSGLNAVFGDQIFNGTTIAEIKDPNLKWETTTEFDLGFDWELAGGHWHGVVDAYRKYTEGALFNIPLPAGLGDNNNSMLTNAADISNMGIELTAGYKGVSQKGLRYQIDANATFNKNQVENLGLGQPTNFGSLNNGHFATRVAAGQPIGAFWLYKTDGVYQTQAEIDNSPHVFGTTVGDLKIVDTNGDGIISDLDREYMGSYQPKCYFGTNIQMNYKRWDFNMDLFGNLGNMVFNGKKTVRYGGNYNVEYEVGMNRWTPTNPSNTEKRAYNGVPLPSDYYLEKGNYLRLNNLSIGYSLPESFAKKTKVKGYRFYVTAQNLFTWKSYSGFTAELPGAPPEAGIEISVYPTSRTLMSGLSIQF